MLPFARLCTSQILHHTLTSIAAMLAIGIMAGSCGEAMSSGEEDASLELRLTLPNGRTVSRVHYNITQHGVTVTSGNLNVERVTSLTFRIGGLPAGDGYLINLFAFTDGGAQRCVGETPFQTLGGRVTAVSVTLSCTNVLPTLGSIDFNATLNSCPVIDSMLVLPLIARAGDTIELEAAAHDDDAGARLIYSWSTGSVVFADTINAQYVCPATVEPVQLTLRVNDGRCVASETVEIDCNYEDF